MMVSGTFYFLSYAILPAVQLIDFPLAGPMTCLEWLTKHITNHRKTHLPHHDRRLKGSSRKRTSKTTVSTQTNDGLTLPVARIFSSHLFLRKATNTHHHGPCAAVHRPRTNMRRCTTMHRILDCNYIQWSILDFSKSGNVRC